MLNYIACVIGWCVILYFSLLVSLFVVSRVLRWFVDVVLDRYAFGLPWVVIYARPASREWMPDRVVFTEYDGEYFQFFDCIYIKVWK